MIFPPRTPNHGITLQNFSFNLVNVWVKTGGPPKSRRDAQYYIDKRRAVLFVERGCPMYRFPFERRDFSSAYYMNVITREPNSSNPPPPGASLPSEACLAVQLLEGGCFEWLIHQGWNKVGRKSSPGKMSEHWKHLWHVFIPHKHSENQTDHRGLWSPFCQQSGMGTKGTQN